MQPCPPPLCLSKTQEIASDTPAPGTHVWSICVDKRDNESFVWNVCSLRDSASGKGATRKRHATVWGKFGSVPRLLDPTSAAVVKAWYVGGRKDICDSLTLSSSEYLHQQATTRQRHCNSSWPPAYVALMTLTSQPQDVAPVGAYRKLSWLGPSLTNSTPGSALASGTRPAPAMIGRQSAHASWCFETAKRARIL